MSPSFSRLRRAFRTQSSFRKSRVLRAEALEPREVLSGVGLWDLAPLLAAKGRVGTVNATPVVVKPISFVVSGNKAATLSVLGSDDKGESNLIYNWSVTPLGSGGSANFSASGTNAAKTTTITFGKAGAYNITVSIVDAGGLRATTGLQLYDNQVLTSITMLSADTLKPLVPGTPLKATSASQRLTAVAYDQFGNAMTYQPAFKWTTNSAPSGATASIAVSGAVATLGVSAAGTYGVSVAAKGDYGASASNGGTIQFVAQPTYLQITQVGGTAEVKGKSAQFTVVALQDQFHNAIGAAASVAWSMVTGPNGAAAPTFATASGTTTVTFSAAGQYTLKAAATDNSGNSVWQTVNVAVAQVPTAGSSTTTLTCGTTKQQLPTPSFTDQFGKTISVVMGLTWSTVAVPNAAPAPTFATSGGVTTATFGMAGTYTLKDSAPKGANFTLTVIVSQTFTSIAVTPNIVTLTASGSQLFTAQALDQFQRAMATQPQFTWTATSGGMSPSGMYNAPSSAGSVTVTAASGSVSGTATVTVGSGGNTLPFTLADQNLASFVQNLFADGAIGRADMIQILYCVASRGVVNSMDFGDLKTILSNAGKLNMPGYVQVLAGDVINGNTANATYQGQSLGNLTVNSSATQLNNLIGKWFLGADHPTLTSTSYGYRQASGTLFPVTPTHSDEYQGMLGDCYFISSLGTIADRNPTAIRNMFIDNGDGTYTVRLYGGQYGAFYNADGTVSDGFSNNQGTADYVTVDGMLPTNSSGMLVYANYGMNASNTSNSLWIPLAEKAYAQWNQTGKEGRDGTNSYAGIEGGWMATVDAQILGHNATDYSLTTATKTAMLAALSAGKAVTIGTYSAGGNGLYGSHAYAVIGYEVGSDTFRLYNPWGSNQPGLLTWSQLQSTCSEFVVADASGSTAIAGGNVHAAATDTVFGSDDSRHVRWNLLPK